MEFIVTRTHSQFKMSSTSEHKELPHNVVVEERVRMTAHITKKFEDLPLTIEHQLYPKELPWPTKTDVVCWHDCHPFDGMPFPLVSRYCYERKIAVCFGNFCSPNCGRAYAVEHRPLSYQHSLVHYTYILWKSFGIPPEKCTGIANPRECLLMFGGTQTIQEFRSDFTLSRRLRINDVSFCIQNVTIVEVLPDHQESDIQVNSSLDTDGGKIGREARIITMANDVIARELSRAAKRKHMPVQRTAVGAPEAASMGHQIENDNDDASQVHTSLLDEYIGALAMTHGNAEDAAKMLLSGVQTKRDKKPTEKF